mmetsp:Transcript_16327/g.37668  ORF Transcript_16327/g.37668 Transcript_16327/m.37668 type:complete len:233 (+) Transcript_16327:82-780(+)
MFSCTACKPADPTTATVKVDPTLLAADRENVAPNSQQNKVAELERQQKEQEARERAQQERKAEEERRRREADRQEHERREQERREHEQRLEQEREQAERRAAEEREAERLRIAAEAERARAEEDERKKQDIERQEENKRREDQERLSTFLTSKGYGTDVNGKRKTMMKFYRPLHDAVHAKDDELVRILLEAGADPTMRSSSGKTPLERAERSNVDGSLTAIVERLTAAMPSS